MKVCVMLTCFNRKDKTLNCIKSLISGNKCQVDFIVVDDGSTDGTGAALEDLAKELYERDSEHASIEVIAAAGGLYYSGGMRRAMEAAKARYGSIGNNTTRNDAYQPETGDNDIEKESCQEPDFYILANDDVEFDRGVLDGLMHAQSVNEHKENDLTGDLTPHGSQTVIVGAMRDDSGKCSYGGIKYYSGIHYKQIGPDAADRGCDTFNANFVAVPKEIFKAVPIIDPVYVHSLGDFDYGLQIKKAGYRIEVTDHFVGTCNNNPSTGTWNDRNLSRIERIKRKESVKGAPAKQWFHFLKKNFGIGYACAYSVTPYIRILLGK